MYEPTPLLGVGVGRARIPRCVWAVQFCATDPTADRPVGAGGGVAHPSMGLRQPSCRRSPDPRILSRRRRIWSRGGRTRRPDVGRRLSPQPETQHRPVGGEVLIGLVASRLRRPDQTPSGSVGVGHDHNLREPPTSRREGRSPARRAATTEGRSRRRPSRTEVAR